MGNRSRGVLVAAAAVVAITLFALGGRAWAQDNLLARPPVMLNGHEASPFDVLVKFRPDKTINGIKQALQDAGIDVFGARKFQLTDWYRVQVSTSYPLQQILELLNAQPDVIRAEADYVVYPLAVPNDPDYGFQWGLENIGAPAAWDVATDASSVTMAVLDTGVDYVHHDLAANMWTNPYEISGKPGVDDDLDGYVDDIYGWDFADSDNNPGPGDSSLQQGHGTHVAGILGAVTNNSIGVAGVCWTAQIMPLRFIGPRGGLTGDAIDATEYAVQHGAKVLNNSWGGASFSQALQDTIYAIGAFDALFIAAAGNDGNDNDASPVYPASYPCPNIIAVAASGADDDFVWFEPLVYTHHTWSSNYGASSVDICAPGDDIWSTLPNNHYGSMNGTSMATPFVSGACALVWAHYQDPPISQPMTGLEVKEKILMSAFVPPTPVDPTFMGISGRVLTNGRLALDRAISDLAIVTPNPLPTAIPNGMAYSVFLKAVGGTPPYTWSVPDGTFALTGLGLNVATGEISGQPGSLGDVTKSFVVTVTDHWGTTATKLLSLSILSINAGEQRIGIYVHSGRWTGAYDVEGLPLFTPFEGAPIIGEALTPDNQPVANTACSGYTAYYVAFLLPDDINGVSDPTIHLIAPIEFNGLYLMGWVWHTDPSITPPDGIPYVLGQDLYANIYYTENATAVYGEPIDFWVNDGAADDIIYNGISTHVSPGNDANLGVSPSQPKRHIQNMLDHPPLGVRWNDGQIRRIIVSAGNYQENLVLGPQHSGVVLQGLGADAAGSLLDGNQAGPCIIADGWINGIITGFDIINGYNAQNGGGAIRLGNGSNVQIIRNAMRDCIAEEGAGLAGYSSMALIQDNVFENNTTVMPPNTVPSGEGGAIYFSEGYPTIFGNAISGCTATNGGGIRCLLIQGDITKNWIYGCTAQGLVPVGSDPAGQGGAIYLKSSPGNHTNITSNFIGVDRTGSESGNKAGEGGGIYATLSQDTIGDNVYMGNQATLQGGGALIDSFSNTDMAGSIFVDNSAGPVGGGLAGIGGGLAVRFSCGVASLDGCSFTYNTAAVAGGALSLNDNCTVGESLKSTFDHNTSHNKGGAIYMTNNCELTAFGAEDNLVNPGWCSVSDNTADIDGGGIYLERSCTMTLHQVRVQGNTATAGNGGGMYMRDGCSPGMGSGAVAFGKTWITDNIAGLNGGNIFVGQNCSPLIGTASGDYDPACIIISGNATNFGGGLCLLQSAAPALLSCVISGNTATYGGGVYAGTDSGGSVSITVIDSNTAIKGGGVFVPAGSHVGVAAVISSNSAADGGGVYLEGSDGDFGACSIDYNTASDMGGGVHCALGDMSYFSGNWISYNQAGANDKPGQGVYITNSSPTFDANNILGHSLILGEGAGVRVESSSILFERNLLRFNSAPSGAGFYEEDSTVTLAGNVAQGNTATVAGGGFYITSPTTRFSFAPLPFQSGPDANGDVSPPANTYQPGNLIDNTAPIGAGIYMKPKVNTDVLNNLVVGNAFNENRATDGAGLYSDGASPRILNCLAIGNSAQRGAGMFIKGMAPIINSKVVSPSVSFSTFVANFAEQYAAGGGLYTDASRTVIASNIFSGNRYDIRAPSGTLVNYTDYEDASSGVPGTGSVGNIKSDPLLVGQGFQSQWADPDPTDVYGVFVGWSNGTYQLQFIDPTGAIAENQFAGCWLNPNIKQNRLFYIFANSKVGEGIGKKGKSNGKAATDIWVMGDPIGDPMATATETITRTGDTFQIWDFHEQSTGGHWVGGGWATDIGTSPCINRGDPKAKFGNEPDPNGGRANMGAYGNTDQASKSGQIPPGGFLHGVAAITSSWTTVTFSQPFPDTPVVVATPATENDVLPGVVRVTEVGRASFKVRFENWPYAGSAHKAEKVHWMACVKGIYDLGSGDRLIADTETTTNTNILNPFPIGFPQRFSDPPAVFVQVQTENDSKPVTARITAITTATVKLCMQVQKKGNQSHQSETIGYIAISPSAAMLGSQSVQVVVTGAVVTQDPYLVVTNLGQCTIRVSDDMSNGKLPTHKAEKIAYIVLGDQPPIAACMQTARGTNPCTLRVSKLADSFQYETGVMSINSSWKTMTLSHTYTSPIVIVGPATNNVAKYRGVVRVQGITPTKFQARFENWPNMPTTKHSNENIAYIVVERGGWQVDGGRQLVADKLLTANINVARQSTFNFSLRFAETPVIVTTTQTEKNNVRLTERMSSIASNGFHLSLQAPPTVLSIKTLEQVGYLALGSGSGGVVAGVFQPVAGTVSAANPVDWKIFISSYLARPKHLAETIGMFAIQGMPHTAPYFVASMQTTRDRNLAALRCNLIPVTGP